MFVLASHWVYIHVNYSKKNKNCTKTWNVAGAERNLRPDL